MIIIGARMIKCLPSKERAAISAAVGKGGKASKSSPKASAKASAADVASFRHLFDDAVASAVAHLETACLPSFLASVHYNYVLALKAKESAVLSMQHFKPLRVLGQGGFGQVLEVVIM